MLLEVSILRLGRSSKRRKIPAITSFDRLNELADLSYEFEPKYTKKSLETFMNRQDLATYLKE